MEGLEHIKSRIEQMKNAVREISNLHWELNDAVHEVARRVEVAQNDFCNKFEYEWTLQIEGYCEPTICCTWEETWRYGGHETHNFIFPAKLLVRHHQSNGLLRCNVLLNNLHDIDHDFLPQNRRMHAS